MPEPVVQLGLPELLLLEVVIVVVVETGIGVIAGRGGRVGKGVGIVF